MGMFQHLNHGADIAGYFESAEILEDLEKRTKSGEKYFENLIKKYLLDNPHVLKLTMIPTEDHLLQS